MKVWEEATVRHAIKTIYKLIKKENEEWKQWLIKSLQNIQFCLDNENYKICEYALKDITFKWFDRYGNIVEYGKHDPLFFEISGDVLDSAFDIIKVKLPVLDYGIPNQNPKVTVYYRKINK